ncbi:MAG TPA: NAD-dependent deacylase [Candidatus Angelobacter sp.]|nr:NAD-dependent deacylase [Candidatus Angelobacter sp.]
MTAKRSPRDRFFVLTGAGISAESGLPTFRGMNGIWRTYRVEDVASPAAFAADPALVWQFYSERRKRHATVEPNPAHHALAEMEHAFGDHFFLCTQNVDSLHEQAGSRRVIHMHGRVMQSRCSDPRCASRPFDDRGAYATREEIRRCEVCGALVRPHICWFDEVPFEMELILHQLSEATFVLVVGTSGVVEPAASFVRMARRDQARTIYVGPEEPANRAFFDEVLLGKAGEELPKLVRELVSE